MSKPASSYQRGNAYPYDASDSGRARKPKDWAHKAARGILADLGDRHTIKWGFDDIDYSIRKEIVDSLAEIIRIAEREQKP